MKKWLVAAAMASAAVLLMVSPAFAASTHTVTGLTYQTPAIGNEDLGGICLGPNFLGTTLLDSCVVDTPLVGDNSVRVTINDNGPLNPVSFSVGEEIPPGSGNITNIQSFCGSGVYTAGVDATTGAPRGLDYFNGTPVPLTVFPYVLPGIANWDTFPPSLAPCVGVATSGSVTLTYYSSTNGT